MASTKRGMKPLLRLTSNERASTDIPKARFIHIDATLPTSAGIPVTGVVAEDTPSGNYVSIVMNGIVFVELSGTVTPGDLISTDVDGKAKQKSTDEYVIGIALDSGDADDIIRVKLN
jgi:hypothetical protein